MKYFGDNKEITLDFSDLKWRELLERLGIKKGALDEEDVRRIFCFSFEMFLKGEYSTDDLSSICAHLFDNLKDKSKYPELFDALEAGSELGFYIRDKNLLPNFKHFMEELFDAYDSLCLRKDG